MARRRPSVVGGWRGGGRAFVVVLVVLAAAHWWSSHPSSTSWRPQVLTEIPPESPGRGSALSTHEEGCPAPVAFHATRRELEAPDRDQWQVLRGAGDRLREDDCGQLWSLWFNSWNVHPADGSARLGTISLGRAGPVAAIARAGVAAFLPLRDGELWVLGSDGSTARWRASEWEDLGLVEGCRDGQLFRRDGDVWLACHKRPGAALLSWSEDEDRWLDVAAGPGPALEQVASDEHGQLVAVGGGIIARYFGDALPGGWERVASGAEPATALAAAEGRIFVGSEKSLQMYSRDGQLLASHAAPGRVTGLAADGRGGAWASFFYAGIGHVSDQGLRRWRYSQGLRDDEARDLLIDSRDQLWVGGSDMGVMLEPAAHARLADLPAPPSLPGEIHADACVAARALLGTRTSSGSVARVDTDDGERVFFNGRQVCPSPTLGNFREAVWQRREDGALLRLPLNARRGSSDCGGPCTDAQRQAFAGYWQPTLWPAVAGVAGKPTVLPAPTPIPDSTPVAAALWASDGSVWMGASRGGLYRHGDGAWQRMGIESGPDPDAVVRSLAEDADGAIWVGTEARRDALPGSRASAGLHRFRNRSWTHHGQAQGLPTDAIHAIHPALGGLWVAAWNGLFRRQEEGFVPVTGEGQGNRTRGTVLAGDAIGGLWFAHPFDRGVVAMRGGLFRATTTREGLFEDRIEALAHDGEGRVWLMAVDGRVAVYPAATLAPALPAIEPDSPGRQQAPEAVQQDDGEEDQVAR